MKIIIVNALKSHEATVNVTEIVTTKNYDEWFEKMSTFAEDELEEYGVYEFDGWDEELSYIQIPDDEDDWLPNFNKLVEKVKNVVTTK